MKNLDLQVCFEMEIKQLDNLLKANSVDIEYWLNIGLDKFVKTRYSGNNVKGHGFESSQKRIDDLRTLVSTASFKIASDGYSYTYNFNYDVNSKSVSVEGEANVIQRLDMYIYTFDLPVNYMFTLGEDVSIVGQNDGWKIVDGKRVPKATTVTEVTIDNVTEKLVNSLSKHILHRNNAAPLRLIADNKVKVFTDGNYTIDSYLLTYLRIPNKIDIHTKPLDEYKDMPEHTHIEIVKLAAQAFFENQSNQRYQTYSNEINTME